MLFYKRGKQKDLNKVLTGSDFMPPLFPGMMTELFYSLVIIVSSMIIYFSTKELYDLSQHKGIKYFRNAFLFFGISFIFFFLIKFIVFSFNLTRIPHFNPMFLGNIILFIFIYASTIAMFYLLYSVMWKKIDDKRNYNKIPIFHVIALIVSFLSVSTQNGFILLLIQALVFLFIAIESYMNYRKSKKEKNISSIYIIYFLVFAFWILNIIDIIVPNFFSFVQIIIYTISSFIWLIILYKVLKKTGSV